MLLNPRGVVHDGLGRGCFYQVVPLRARPPADAHSWNPPADTAGEGGGPGESRLTMARGDYVIQSSRMVSTNVHAVGLDARSCVASMPVR